MRLRRGQAADVPAMLELKAQLRFQAGIGRSTRGGFLLGSTEAGYKQRLRDGRVWVLDDPTAPHPTDSPSTDSPPMHGRVEGFAIVLPDAAFKASELWQRRGQMEGTVDVAAFEAMKLGYFDQLAVRPGASRRYSAALALTAMMDLMQTGVDAMITATVVEPVVNLAAVPFVQRMGGVCVGRLDEHTPEVGPLVSEIWVVPRAGYTAWVEGAPGRGAAWIRGLAAAALEAP